VAIFPSRILLAITDSEEADLASRVAVDLADSTGSELLLVYVGQLPTFLMKDLNALGFDRRLYDEIERESLEVLWKLTLQVKATGGTVAGAHLRMGAWPRRSCNLSLLAVLSLHQIFILTSHQVVD